MTVVLGIETSCDDTGISIYDSCQGVISNILFSQDIHTSYGGVVPELAARYHMSNFLVELDRCFSQTNYNIADIDLVAYTYGPGLNSSLLVGATFANAFAWSNNKPIVPVNHLEGHILSVFLNKCDIKYPFLSLLVSGGHTQLILVKTFSNYQVLGETLDDAVGETFDKVAKMLGLSYPGGPQIDALAASGRDSYKLPRPMFYSKSLDFSFSGLKTAVSLLIQKLGGRVRLTQTMKADIACSTQCAIIDVLMHKLQQASIMYDINNIIICGGVSANSKLRSTCKLLKADNIYYPDLEYCTDNAAMIALAGYLHNEAANKEYNLNVYPRLKL